EICPVTPRRRLKPIAAMARDVLDFVRGDGAKMTDARKKDIRGVLDTMASRFGYCDQCTADAAAMLVRKRFDDIIS
ncbi:MAG: hypothetical protein ACOC1F_08440, partial [Myxococcota bacterium]